MSRPEKKERVHFGTLERDAVSLAKRKRQEEEEAGDHEETGEAMLAESTSARDRLIGRIDLDQIDEAMDDELDDEALETRRRAMDEFARKRLARSIAVPTDDAKVRMELRNLDHPVCLFGEDAGDRRDRLRYVMSKLAMDRKRTEPPDEHLEEGSAHEGEEKEEEEEEEEEEEFYTEGSEELRLARHQMAVYSLARARNRLDRQRKDCNADLAVVRQRRQALVKTLQSYTNDGSQVGGERPLSRAVFAADSQTVLVGSWSGSIKLWTVPQCKEVRAYRGHTDRVGGLAFRPHASGPADSANGSVDFASGGADKCIFLWSLAKETPVGTLAGHANRVVHVDFHPSGQYLGSASYDGTWRLWDVATERELLLQEGHSRELFCLRFQCDGSLVATAGLDGVGRVWDVRSGRSVMSLEGHAKEIFGLDWSPNGFHVATGSADNTVRVFDLRKAESLCQIPAHKSMVTDVRFFHGPFPASASGLETGASGCGQYLATASNDGLVNVWTAGDWKLQKSLPGHVGKVMSIDIAADGSYIASAGYDRTFKLWGPEDFA